MARSFSMTIYRAADGDVYPDEYIKQLARDLRPQDKADLEAACFDAEFAIRQSIAFSEVVYIYLDDRGRCISMLGLGAQDYSSLGRSIWSVSANEINKGYVKTLLIKQAKMVVEKWADAYGLLQNVVNIENKTSIHYMEKVLGAVFLPESIEANGHTWRAFYILGKGGK